MRCDDQLFAAARIPADPLLGGRDQLDGSGGRNPLSDHGFELGMPHQQRGVVAEHLDGAARRHRDVAEEFVEIFQLDRARDETVELAVRSRNLARQMHDPGAARPVAHRLAQIGVEVAIVAQRLEEVPIRDIDRRHRPLPGEIDHLAFCIEERERADKRHSGRLVAQLDVHIIARHAPCDASPAIPPNSAICSRVPLCTVSTALKTDSICRARIRAVFASSRWFSTSARLRDVDTNRPVPAAMTADSAIAQMMVSRMRPMDMAGAPPPFCRRQTPARAAFPFPDAIGWFAAHPAKPDTMIARSA